jgi:hypothetical protein
VTAQSEEKYIQLTGQLSQVQSFPQLQVLEPEQPQLPLLTRVKMVDCMVSEVFEVILNSEVWIGMRKTLLVVLDN